MHNWYNFALILLLFSSCAERFVDNYQDPGYEFFPVETGAFWIYDVMEIGFDASGPDTSFFELRNKITQRVTQGEEGIYTLQRETRISAQDSWQVQDIWSVRRNQYSGIVVEENVPYVKMSFPVVLNNTWDGHAYNTMDPAEYEYRVAIGADYDALIGTSEKILVQISDIPQNLVNRDQRFEVYAKGIGLVEKNYIILNYCTSNCGSEEVDSGMIIEQVLTSYGQD